jgi:hypothetical protein
MMTLKNMGKMVLTLQMNQKTMRHFILLIVFFTCTSLSGQVRNFSDSLGIDYKATQLELLYQMSQESKENKIRFFEEFPDDFKTFVRLYGYMEKEEELQLSILYNQSYNHLSLLFNSPVSNVDYINKMVNLSYEGTWQSDAVSILQNNINKIVKENRLLVINLLSKRNDKEIRSFWHFFFDGPHPENYQKDYEELYQHYHKENSRITKLMEQSYEKLLKNRSQGH